MNLLSKTCLSLVSLALPICAQQSTTLAPSADSIEAQSQPSHADGPIVVDVVVTDKAGKPISGLHKQDFTVLDNKQPRQILDFHALQETSTSSPTEVVLLVDTTNATFSTVASERDQINRFLKQSGEQLPFPVTFIFFTDTGTQIQTEPSRDRSVLMSYLNQQEVGLRTIRRSAGFYGAVERFDLSLHTLKSLAAYESKRPGRKLLIWISPGWPYLSGPNVNLSRKEEESLFHSITSISTALRQARITLYSIDPVGVADAGGFRTYYYESFLKGVSKPEKAQAGDLALQVIAVQSGGRVLNSSNDISTEIATCVADANASYVLSIAPGVVEHAEEYHPLAVTVSNASLTARTRAGYYTQP